MMLATRATPKRKTPNHGKIEFIKSRFQSKIEFCRAIFEVSIVLLENSERFSPLIDLLISHSFLSSSNLFARQLLEWQLLVLILVI